MKSKKNLVTVRFPFLVSILFCLPFFLCNDSCADLGEDFLIKLIELERNEATAYYTARVEVKKNHLKNRDLDFFYLRTSTRSFRFEELTFVAEAGDPQKLEQGDQFLVVLNQPDWKLYIGDRNHNVHDSINFWEYLPEADRWHPLKSEAAGVAESIRVAGNTVINPVVADLPEEWRLSAAEETAEGLWTGYASYRKRRVGEVKESVVINYARLSSADLLKLESVPESEFLKGWNPWTKKFGLEGRFAGRPALVWDMPGFGQFGWSYRYIYIDSGLVIEATIEADPLEWKKGEAEKRLEREQRRIILTYRTRIQAEPYWSINIQIRLNGEGNYHKSTPRGISTTRRFMLQENETLKLLELIDKINNTAFTKDMTFSEDSYPQLIYYSNEVLFHLNTADRSEPEFAEIEGFIIAVISEKTGESIFRN